MWPRWSRTREARNTETRYASSPTLIRHETSRACSGSSADDWRGRNLELVEHRVLRRLAKAGIRQSRAVDEKRRGYTVTENLALTLGLAIRAQAPMRSREKMRTVIEGIEAMEFEGTAFWLAWRRTGPTRATC